MLLTLPIDFDRGICGDPTDASSREWLETNGIGGFACSTIIGLNTRRYHSLLTAALTEANSPSAGRFVLLSKLEETLLLDNRQFELSANRYPNVIHPRGYEFLESFRLDPFPIFEYRCGDARLRKSIFLVHGENTVVVEYEIAGELRDRSCKLQIRPLIAFRDYHATAHANDAIGRDVTMEPGLASIAPSPTLPRLYFAHNAVSVDTSGFWFYNFEYDRELERGLDHTEDLYSPFDLTFDLAQDRTATIVASTLPRSARDSAQLRQAEIQRRRCFREPLVAAADQFIIARGNAARGEAKSIIAGYPWFSDWGRDTMISLPGLTLVTGRYEDARAILRCYARSLNQGMLPNRFADSGQAPEYNTADATLWMFHSVYEFLRYTRDYDFVRAELYESLAGSIAWHVRGTRYGIHLDNHGLLHAGEPGMQLTWMDARVDSREVTPRQGQPVEIQALWYNALRVMERLATKFGDATNAQRYAALADRARAEFIRVFWNPANGCLFDVIGDDGAPDSSIRPNQVFAVSLPFAPIDGDMATRVIDVVEWELLTPFGLRTLSPRDPDYRGRYEGDPRSRDAAYHQGTVWPWLLGPFITAYVKLHDGSKEARNRAMQWLRPLCLHLLEAGVGQISEVFDGDAPHRPAGCFAQAWSVAEVLRSYKEDALGERPA